MRCEGQRRNTPPLKADGSNDTVFLSGGTSRALAGLKKAKRAIVEAEFFQRGRQQFVFETAGLNWK